MTLLCFLSHCGWLCVNRKMSAMPTHQPSRSQQDSVSFMFCSHCSNTHFFLTWHAKWNVDYVDYKNVLFFFFNLSYASIWWKSHRKRLERGGETWQPSICHILRDKSELSVLFYYFSFNVKVLSSSDESDAVAAFTLISLATAIVYDSSFWSSPLVFQSSLKRVLLTSVTT